jgi:hypothetical protein
MRGEGATADSDSAGKWRENATPIITQYAPKDIFNAVEIAALHFATTEVTGFKERKVPGSERV